MFSLQIPILQDLMQFVHPNKEQGETAMIYRQISFKK